MFSDGLGEGKVRNGGWEVDHFCRLAHEPRLFSHFDKDGDGKIVAGCKIGDWSHDMGWLDLYDLKVKWKQPFIGSKSIVIVHITWYAPESYLEGQGISHFTWNCHTSMLRSLKMCCSWRIGTLCLFWWYHRTTRQGPCWASIYRRIRVKRRKQIS